MTPLNALVYDIERNLRAPLIGLQRAAEREQWGWHDIRVDVRTGDTPSRDRQRQTKDPGHILVTTPESLFLMLGSKMSEKLAQVETVIIDEIHSLAPTKRGAHLALSLERLSAMAVRDPQRIGLSATVSGPDEVARFLGGERSVTIVDRQRPPNLDITVSVPVPDLDAPRDNPGPEGGSILAEIYRSSGEAPAAPERGAWPAIYPALLKAIHAHRSTIVFVNSRGLCERLAQRLNELAEEELVRAHHGSVSHDKRAEIEESLKAGEVRAIVATSSLELGIDMGAVDLVLLVESPGAVSRGLQRVGRAGHQVDTVSRGIIFPKFKGDILEAGVVAQRMLLGRIESTIVPQNALDVLAQQIVAMCCATPMSVDAIERLIRASHPYRELSRPLLEAVLDMLSGRYPSAEFADLRPLLAWDRTEDILSPRRGAPMVSRMNAGTIPDRGLYAVHVGEEGPRIGELDEEMVFETREGENITLGASTWRVEQITRDRVYVSPAPGEAGRLPFWRGDGPGRPIELGRAIGEFLREAETVLRGGGRDTLFEHIRETLPLDGMAAENLTDYLEEQCLLTDGLPTDQTVVVERFRDELGDWRVCLLTPFGSRVHAPWAMALQFAFSSQHGFEVQVMYTDDGIVLRFADTETLPPIDALFPEPDALEESVTEQLSTTALFAGLFRENAARSLLLPRRRADRRNPLWAQRLKSQNLLATVLKYESFPIVLETLRQALSDVFDLASLRELLRKVRSREIRISEVETPSASPFARSLVFAYVAAFIYEQDAPLAERKAQALSLDRNLLAELLGQGEARELIDAAVLSEVEADLQSLVESRHARDADETHDLLRRLGDLTHDEITTRTTDDPTPWLTLLERERRAVAIRVAGEERWIAAQDAALYRDTLGISLPTGLPQAYLAPQADALRELIARYARTHGPFTANELGRRFDLLTAQVEPALKLAEREGRMVYGDIRPDGQSPEWCDADVFRRLKRQTLARLRNEIAPVDEATLGRFLPAWHDVGTERGGPERLLEALRQLEGLALPWSALVDVILPARVRGFRADDLDMMAASGALVWVGCGALGARDGRIALYLREHAGTIIERDESFQPSLVAGQILDALEKRGAMFVSELETFVETEPGQTRPTKKEFEATLWDLVWAGQVTNDTFGPLRGLNRRGARARVASTLAGGRWSRVDQLVRNDDPTRRALYSTQMLLERYAVVSREAAQYEKLAGGFSRVYPVLKSMEESGRLRRGYFVEGLSGAQFAHIGAVDRLRAFRDTAPERDDVRVLSAIDPANPYGALLPWPSSGNDDLRPRRANGTWVILVDGFPLIYISNRGRQLVFFLPPPTLSELDQARACEALDRVPKVGRRGPMLVEQINGLAAKDSPFRALLSNAGFVSDYRGLMQVSAPA
ncbi:MAG: helicase-related protein [Pseudomonadota bacterium]